MKWEGFEADAYLCPAGVWTIGYGETKAVKKGDKTTKEEATKKLEARYKEFEGSIKPMITASLTPNQLAACVSFSYNVGVGAFKTSTLLKKINLRDFVGASQEFHKWNKGGGKVLPGLVSRRKEESDLFAS